MVIKFNATSSQILKVTGTLCIVFVLRGCQAKPTSTGETFILPPRSCLYETANAAKQVNKERLKSMNALLITNLRRYKKKIADVTEHTCWYEAMDGDWAKDVRVPVYDPLQKKSKIYEDLELYLQLAYRIRDLAIKMDHVSHRRELNRSYETIVGELEDLQCAVQSYIIDQNITLNIPRKRKVREEVQQIDHNNLYINAKTFYHSLQNYFGEFKKDLKKQIR